MTEKELIQLGFEKQVDDWERVNDTFYYYTLDITSGLSFITQANDEVENGEWVVEIFESPDIKFKDAKTLSTLIDILTQK
jgi:hypothetical protein